MKNITPDLVVAYHKYLAKTFNFRIINKNHAPEMQLIAEFLPRFVSIDKETFLAKYSTTLYNLVYSPHDIGSGSERQLFRQIKIITHEAQHVADFTDDPLEMMAYLVPSSRAHLEARAKSTSIYLQWWYNQKVPNLIEFTASLYDYGLKKSDIDVVSKHLRMHIPIAKRDQIPNDLVVKKGISWLNRNQ
jgi:hypothetical protein